MIHKSKVDVPYAEENENSWLGSNLYRLMLIVTVVWFAIVLIYITQFFGWSNLFLMMPDEFGGFLAGATLPLALIWVGMAYVDRSAAFKREAKFLRAYMNQLVYPEEGGSATAKAMSEAIRSQVSELQEVTRLAIGQTSAIKKELDARIDDFASLVRVLDNYSTKSVVELTNGVKILTGSFDGVTDKALATTRELNKCIGEFSAVAGQLQKDINGMADNLLPSMHEIKNSADAIREVAENSSREILEASENIKTYGNISEENFNLVYEKIRSQAKYLEDITSQTVESTKAVGDTFRSVAGEIDELIENRGQKVVSYAENMDNNIQEAYRKLSRHSDQFVEAAEKVAAQTSRIEGNISAQAGALKNIADTVADKLYKAEDALGTGFDSFDKRSSKVLDTLHEMIDMVQAKTEKLTDTTEKACGKLDTGSQTLTERIKELKDISDVSGNSIDEINGRFEKNVATVRKTVDEITGKLSEAADILLAQSEKLNETGNMAVTQSRLAENSLSEQCGSVNSAMNRIENIKAEINRQIDELSQTAERVAAETENAVFLLKDNLSASLQVSGEAAEQTRKINDDLEAEVRRLDEAADAAVEKVSGMKNAMVLQNTHLQGLIASMDDQTAKIAVSMEKHTAKVNEANGSFSRHFDDIVSTFERQSNLFNSMAENTANVSRSIREQIAMLGESADSVFAKMSALEDEVERRGSDVADKSNVAIAKLSEIDQSVTSIIGRITESTEGFNQTVEQVKAASENAALEISGNMEKLKNANDAFGAEFSSMVGKMDDYAGRMDGSVEQIQNSSVFITDKLTSVIAQIEAQNKAINDNFSRHREDLLDAVNQVSAQTRLGEAALNGQYKCLMDVSDAVSEKMSELSKQLKEDVGGLHDNAAALAAEISSLSDRLTQIGGDMNQTAESSVAGIERVGQLLAQCSDDLKQTADNTDRSMGETAERLEEQNGKMAKISEETKSLVDYFNGLMNNTSEQLIENANIAHDKIHELGDSLQRLNKQLEETAASNSRHLADSGDKLRSTLMEVTEKAEQLSGNVRASNEIFVQQTDALKEVADETLTKVNSVMGSFSYSLEDFAAKSNAIVESANNFNGAVQKQIEVLDIGARQAGNELAEIEKRYREMKIEYFLKNATSIIEKLETLAVDINLIFNPESQDKLWQKYYEGDTDVFARYLARTMNRKQVVAIKDEFEKNQEFRKMVTVYMSEFEELINRARSCEKSGILLSVISGADIGKIYYVLARALDKLN